MFSHQAMRNKKNSLRSQKMITTDAGYEIYFGPGRFDSWCVYMKDNNHEKIPLDKDYFLWILNLANKYSKKQVYKDFITIYNSVNEEFDENECYKICQTIDKHYEEDTTHWWVIFYMTMVAECTKKNSILKKRIKHLGVYNILFDEYEVDYVVKYMRGKRWRELDKLMKERGI